MSIKFIAGRVDAEDGKVRDCRIFETWEGARRHVVLLARGDDAGATLATQVEAWTEPWSASAAEGLATTRLFLYPAVLEDGAHRLACPRCLLGVQATEVHHGDVAGSATEAIDFTQTMPTAYRVYCEGDCEAESEECEDVFDALDAYLLRVMWPPRSLLEMLGGGD